MLKLPDKECACVSFFVGLIFCNILCLILVNIQIHRVVTKAIKAPRRHHGRINATCRSRLKNESTFRIIIFVEFNFLFRFQLTFAFSWACWTFWLAKGLILVSGSTLSDVPVNCYYTELQINIKIIVIKLFKEIEKCNYREAIQLRNKLLSKRG